MYYLDLFAGIGGFALGAALAGFEWAGHYYSEVDEYASKVIRAKVSPRAGFGRH
jgi:site-specific DNA-cytosine methylase